VTGLSAIFGPQRRRHLCREAESYRTRRGAATGLAANKTGETATSCTRHVIGQSAVGTSRVFFPHPIPNAASGGADLRVLDARVSLAEVTSASLRLSSLERMENVI
jgi:hypothetical protein